MFGGVAMSGVLIDLDGVVYQDGQLIEGAMDTIAWLKQEAIAHLFVTNTTSKPRSAIVQKLARMGIEVDEQAILTPVVATQAYLKTLSDPALGLFVVDATAQEFEPWRRCTSDAQRADLVILGDLAEQWDFQRLNQAFRWLNSNPDAELIALGMSRYWRGPQGLQLDVGPFVKALEYASGRRAKIMGKPDPLFFQMAAQILNSEPAQLSMIGDDALSDVKAAQDAGLKGILVKTGKYQSPDLGKVEPDHLLDSIAALPDSLSR